LPLSRTPSSSRRSQLLQVIAPDPHVETALRWTAHRLDRAADAVAALALLAIGDFAAARSVIAALDRRPADDADLLYLWLMARYHAASGDLPFLRANWQHVRAVLELRPPVGSDHESTRARAAVQRELALTAEAIGERDDSNRLRADVTPSLPSPDGPGDAAVAALALQHSSLTAWAEYGTGRTRSGFRQWWQEVLFCSDHELSDVSNETLNNAAAMVVASLVFGLLGFEPDAAKHRVRLRPSIPPEWDALDVHNLRISDCTLSVSYARTGDLHLFRLSPTSGAIPLRLIFEPALIATEIGSISIDGAVASLDVRAWGDRRLCPVQIVLDHEREVVIETGSR
jgi:hypothetical protein